MRLLRKLGYASHLARTCAHIARVPSYRGYRWSLFSTYLRLRAKRLLHLSVPEHRAERVAAFRMTFFSYFALDYLFNEIFMGLEYEFEAENEEPFIVDCGSNIGMSVHYFKWLYPRAHVLAFEAGSGAYDRLVRNIELNGLRDVTAHHMALGDREGMIEFFVSPGDPGALLMSTIEQRMPGNVERVKAVRLSSYLHRRVDFLKLDVEGAELDVLRDLQRTGKLRLVQQMVIEYHHHITENDDRLSQLLRILEDEGFGYHISSPEAPPRERGRFQDVMLYAYPRAGATDRSAAIAHSAPEEGTTDRRLPVATR